MLNIYNAALSAFLILSLDQSAFAKDLTRTFSQTVKLEDHLRKNGFSEARLSSSEVMDASCPTGTTAYESYEWSICCANNSKMGSLCTREGPTIEEYKDKNGIRRLINYKNNKREGQFRQEIGQKEKTRIIGYFKNDLPDGKWVVSQEKGPIYEFVYKEGLLSQITKIDASKSKTFTLRGKPFKYSPSRVIGLIHPTFDISKKVRNERIKSETFFYYDKNLKNPAGIALNIPLSTDTLQYQFMPQSIFDSNLGDIYWGESPWWAVLEKSGDSCRVATKGRMQEFKNKPLEEYFLWTTCPAMVDIVEYFKKQDSVWISMSEKFFRSPGGQEFLPIIPKGTSKIDKNTEEPFLEDLYNVSLMEHKTIKNILWVKISLSFGEAKNFEHAWVPFYKGNESRLQIF